MKRKFRIEVVLSAVTGILLCSMDDIYDVLNFLTGDNLFTHQLPRAGRVVRIPVFKQHPFLKSIDVSGVTPENVWDVIAEIKSNHPNYIELSPIENWTHIDPTTEMVNMKNGDSSGIIEVNI